MCMIVEAREHLESTLRQNYEMREEQRVHMVAMGEEERVRMAQNAINFFSDVVSDLGRKEVISKPVTSSNKAFTFQAEHKSYNEETPLKKTNQGPFT